MKCVALLRSAIKAACIVGEVIAFRMPKLKMHGVNISSVAPLTAMMSAASLPRLMRPAHLRRAFRDLRDPEELLASTVATVQRCANSEIAVLGNVPKEGKQPTTLQVSGSNSHQVCKASYERCMRIKRALISSCF